MHHSPLRAWAYHLTADLTFAYLQTEMRDHLASLGMMCSRHIKPSSHCCLISSHKCVWVDVYVQGI